MNKKEVKGTILVVLTAILSGFNIVANKVFVANVDPLILTATRGLLVGLVFLIISLVITKKTKKPFKQTTWKNLFLIGALGGAFAFWAFFTGLKLTLAGRAAFLHKTLPLYAALFAYVFLKEKITKQQFAALIVMLAGLITMQLTVLNESIRLGDFLVIGATILWAAENTYAKKVMMNKESNWVVTFSRMFFGSIILFAIIILAGKMTLLITLTAEQWKAILFSGFLLTLYVLTYYWGLKHINLSKAATILLLSPVISLAFAITILGETATITQIIGSTLILIGGYYTINTKSEHRG